MTSDTGAIPGIKLANNLPPTPPPPYTPESMLNVPSLAKIGISQIGPEQYIPAGQAQYYGIPGEYNGYTGGVGNEIPYLTPEDYLRTRTLKPLPSDLVPSLAKIGISHR